MGRSQVTPIALGGEIMQDGYAKYSKLRPSLQSKS